MDKLFKKISKQFNKLEKELKLLNDTLNNSINEEKMKKCNIIIYWDIENTPIPKNKNGFELVSLIRSYVETIYPNREITIKCYFESQNLSEDNKILLNDAGCSLHTVPNPYNKKERSDMLIIRDLFDINENNIVGLISSDGDFKPYLTKLKERKIELFVITNNNKYDIFLPNIIKWHEICSELC